MGRAMFASSAIALLLLTVAAAPKAPADTGQTQWARRCKDWDGWVRPGPPFRVFGNTYYVGTCGISAILVVGDAGDILIDGGPADAADLIAANIQKLGIKLSDVKILLQTHEHFDHVGGLARLRQLTGAQVFASPYAAWALALGGPTPEDPQFADHHTFPPVHVDAALDGDPTVPLGNLMLHAIATPGHTPGALSWQWQSCEGTVCKTIIEADSLTPVSSDGYRFSDHPRTVSHFRRSLARVAALRCDILLSPHPSASHMRDRLLKGDLTDPGACKAYAAGLEKQLDARLAKEAHGG